MDLLTRKKWDRAAGSYDLMNGYGQEVRWAPFKRRLFERMQGRIIFASIGTGQDIQFFPPGRDITGIDISSGMLDRARPRAAAYPGKLDLREVDVHELGLSGRRLRPGVHGVHLLLGPSAGRWTAGVAARAEAGRAASSCSSTRAAATFRSA